MNKIIKLEKSIKLEKLEQSKLEEIRRKELITM